MPVYLVGDVKRMMRSEKPAMLSFDVDNAFDFLDEIFESLNAISSIFQEHPDFLILDF